MPAMQRRAVPSLPAGRVAAIGRAVAAASAAAWLCLAALAAIAQEPPRERIADDKVLGDLLRDQTIHGIYANGDEWIEYHAPDGRSAYWDGCSHPGKWWIADGLACYRYPEDPTHADHCWYVYRRSKRIEFVYAADGPEGPVGGYSLEVTQGNPEHLPLNKSDCLSAAAPVSPPRASVANMPIRRRSY